MAELNAENELLGILLVNLRNAEATFGPGTPPCESIRTTVKEHLESMRAKGISTNLTTTRQFQKEDPTAGTTSRASSIGTQNSVVFPTTLPFRPKPSGS